MMEWIPPPTWPTSEWSWRTPTMPAPAPAPPAPCSSPSWPALAAQVPPLVPAALRHCHSPRSPRQQMPLPPLPQLTRRPARPAGCGPASACNAAPGPTPRRGASRATCGPCPSAHPWSACGIQAPRALPPAAPAHRRWAAPSAPLPRPGCLPRGERQPWPSSRCGRGRGDHHPCPPPPGDAATERQARRRAGRQPGLRCGAGWRPTPPARMPCGRPCHSADTPWVLA
mmetsp:Transcript_27677/g.89052  ORF Transcript_27677/g.89052 Transcript_27677/m.89052 type:complete len:227 (-) Transcript_27677:380-1060(-)